MTSVHVVCIVCVMLVVAVIGVISGRRVKNAADFVFSSGNAGTAVLFGSMVGAHVGSVSTIGAAQVAYAYGWSAMWFSVGAAAGLLLCGFVLAPAFRKSGEETVQGLVIKRYGAKVGTAIAALVLLCSFISPAVQLMAGRALLTRLLSVGDTAAIVLTALLALVYVWFGGFSGAGLLGQIKAGLMVLGVIAGMILIFMNRATVASGTLAGGWFSRGGLADVSPGVSMLLGTAVSQALFQTAISAKNLKHIRLASVCAAATALLLGVGSTLIGIFMAQTHPGIPSEAAFIEFVLRYMPPLLGGLVLAGLLVAILGCCASTLLAASDMFVSDLYTRVLRKHATQSERLWTLRIGVFAALLIGMAVAFASSGTMLVDMNSLTCGARAVLILFPSLTALYGKRKPTPLAIVISSSLGITVFFAGYFLWRDVADPVYFGLLTAGLTLVLFLLCSNKKASRRPDGTPQQL